MRKKELPATLEEAVDFLLEKLPETEKEKLSCMRKEELVKLHFGLGAWIREIFDLWRNDSPVFLSVSKDHAISHPDDVSMLIMERVWERLQ